MTVLNIFKRIDSDAVFFEPGEVIFCEGDEGHEMYVVLEGEVEIIHKDRVLLSVKTGEFFGEMAIIDSAPRSADAVAKTKCKLAVVNEKRFLFLVQETPYFAISVMKIMISRMRFLRDEAIKPK